MDLILQKTWVSKQTWRQRDTTTKAKRFPDQLSPLSFSTRSLTCPTPVHKTLTWTRGQGSVPYLLTLLNVGHGVRLKVQFVRAAEFPVEDDDDHHHHQHRHDHAHYDPEVAALGLRGRSLHPVHSCRQGRKASQWVLCTPLLDSPSGR